MPTDENKKTGLNANEIIIENMKRGFYGLEAQSYRDYNESTGAMGFYQYVPSQWLERMRAFAKKNEFLMNPNHIPTEEQWAKDRYQKDANGKILTRKNKKGVIEKVPLTIEQGQAYFAKILENSAFQDEFFKHDMEELGKMNEAKSLYNRYADMTGYSLEGFVGLVHYLGSGGAKEILKKAETDPSVLDKRTNFNNRKSANEYAGEVTTRIQNQGGIPDRKKGYDVKGNVVAGDNKRMAAFKEQYQKIKNSKLSDAAREQSFTNLYNAVGSAGYQTEMSQFIEEDNQKLIKEKEKFLNGEGDAALLHQIIQDPNSTLKTFKDGSYEITLNGENRQELYEKTKKLENEGLVTGWSQKDSPGQVVKNTSGKFWGGIWEGIKDAKDLASSVIDPIGTAGKIAGRRQEEEKDSKAQTYVIKGKSASRMLTYTNNELKKINGGQSVYFDDKGNSKSPIILKRHAQAVTETIKNSPVPTAQPVDWTQYDQTIIPTATDADTADTTNETDGTTTTKKDEIDPAKIKRMNEEADTHFNRFVEPKELDVPDTWKYDPKNYKREMPWEALAYGAMGLMGMGDAKTPLPERTDEISQAILSYTNNLKRMSEMGLKPEEEAKLKDDLAGAYQESLDQLVRASNGNRNVVLGNMGSLNKNRLDAIGNMAMMDVMKKDAAYEKYGKALEYVQNFNTTKAMDNHKIKLDAAKEKRAAGAALAGTGFSSMLAELQHQKENGPGSMTHQYMKTMMVNLTGVDSDIEDNGKGDTPFTVSYNKARKAEAAQNIALKTQEYNEEKAIVDNWNTKSQEQKNKYDSYGQYLDRTRNPEQYAVKASPLLRDHMVQGGSLPISRLNPMLANTPLLGVEVPPLGADWITEREIADREQ